MNGEHRVRTRDISIDEQFGYRNGKIVYAAFEPDARWGWKDFSVIKILDVHSGEQRTLLHKTKYFTPDISPDGNKIAAVQVLPGGKSELHILDANDGKIIQQFHSDEISVFTDPKFIDDSALVTAVRLNDGRMALAMADMATGGVVRLTTPSYGIVGYLSINNGVVFFTASFSGNDELYALQLKDKKIFRLTQTSLGNYFVNATGKKLVWSGFTAEGYQLKEMNFDETKWIEVQEAEIKTPASPFPVAKANELHDILLNEVPQRKFATSNYKQAGHLFHFHIWRPYFEDPDFTYSLYSDNILNTLSTEIFYHYNRDDKTNGLGMNFLYGAWYPFINGGLEYTFNQPVTKATQHIYSRLGYSFSIDHRHAISLYSSYQFIGSASLYLPGFFSTHSIVFKGSFQQRDTTNILFSNLFANARGYDEYYFSRMWRLSANYHFPIVYPDWGFGNILYFQRIRGNAFFDFERVYSKDKTVTRDLRSVGGEVYFDTRWWNEYPLTFGVRYSHLLDNELAGTTQKNVFEILIPIVIPQ